jgi:putative N6-adenine-specific DNA methylase
VPAAESLFVATTPGLEGVLLREAQALGDARAVRGGVQLRGPTGLHRRANLRLRCATRVWLEGAKRQDTTGEPLSRRGWRQEGSRAPLSETLAAGLLELAGHRPAEPFWDPLCGSGTIVIEAALASRRMAPGLGRAFAFEQFPSFDASAYAAEKAAAERDALKRAPSPVLASDLNAGALGTARRNARRAGVLEDLTLFRHDATQPWKELPEGTLAIANLPYGKRVGAELDLAAFYGKVAKAVGASGVNRAAFLAADPEAAQWLGLEHAEVHSVDNGGIRCQFIVAALR